MVWPGLGKGKLEPLISSACFPAVPDGAMPCVPKGSGNTRKDCAEVKLFFVVIAACLLMARRQLSVNVSSHTLSGPMNPIDGGTFTCTDAHGEVLVLLLLAHVA